MERYFRIKDGSLESGVQFKNDPRTFCELRPSEGLVQELALADRVDEAAAMWQHLNGGTINDAKACIERWLNAVKEVNEVNDEKNHLPTSKLVDEMIHRLPNVPGGIWSPDGDEILCDTNTRADTIADLLDALYGGQVATTGFYEDVEDELFGWYYVRIDGC